VIEGIVLVEGPSTFVRSLPGWLILRASGPAVEAAPASQ
jgi:hypothetical protein